MNSTNGPVFMSWTSYMTKLRHFRCDCVELLASLSPLWWADHSQQPVGKEGRTVATSSGGLGPQDTGSFHTWCQSLIMFTGTQEQKQLSVDFLNDRIIKWWMSGIWKFRRKERWWVCLFFLTPSYVPSPSFLLPSKQSDVPGKVVIILNEKCTKQYKTNC